MEHIFLHGLGQTPESWNRILEQLGTHANCPDLSRLSSAKPLTYSDLYRAFSEKCDTAKGEIHLCGLSLGGVLALHYTLEHPDKVRSLVLIAAQYCMPKAALRLQNALFHLMPEGMFAQTGFSKADMISLCASMTDMDFSGSLPKIRCPVLVVCGKRDRTNLRAAKELSERIPSARLDIIPGSGHEVNRDAPEKLAGCLQHFYQTAF